MKKILLTLVVLSLSMLAFSQAPPPPSPGTNPDGASVNGDRVNRVSAPIGGEIVILSLFAGGYALVRRGRRLVANDDQRNLVL